ncbi:helix-turn-helix domain-containing protein [Ruminococcaceae bacterium OttesenSCG-928-A11]|nr:helix-turn-helix domain-containing protein [Ruminococcaceae bacterium OttesenSCG-928-A11]
MSDKVELDYTAIGRRIKTMRQDKGYTQEKLAEAVGLATSYMSGIETAAEKVGLSSLVAIANALDVSMDYLLAGNVTVGETYLQNDIQDMINSLDAGQKALFIDLIGSCYETIRRHPTKAED